MCDDTECLILVSIIIGVCALLITSFTLIGVSVAMMDPVIFSMSQ